MNSNVARAILAFVVAVGGAAPSLRDEAGISAADLANPRRMLDVDRIVILLNNAAHSAKS